MVAFIIRRLLWMVVLLLVISFITFVIFYMLPAADPAHAARRARSRARSWWRRSATRSASTSPGTTSTGSTSTLVFHFDFGYSYQNNVSVKAQIFDRLPATLTLAVGAAVVWLLVGIPVGIISAIKRGTWMDRVAMGSRARRDLGAGLLARPRVAVPLLQGHRHVPDLRGPGRLSRSGNIFTDPGQVIPALILPWCVLAAAFAAIYARFLRGNLLETMSEDYIRTARAQGPARAPVVFKHGVRSAITPIVTILGLDLGILLGGAILTETVFNIPGIGRLAYDAIQKSDLPTVQGTVLMGAFFIILLNLIVDIVYAFLDPRVRY